jgi:hypothetical protein
VRDQFRTATSSGPPFSYKFLYKDVFAQSEAELSFSSKSSGGNYKRTTNDKTGRLPPLAVDLEFCTLHNFKTKIAPAKGRRCKRKSNDILRMHLL